MGTATRLLIIFSLIAFCSSASVLKSSAKPVAAIDLSSDEVAVEDLRAGVERTTADERSRAKRKPCAVFCLGSDKQITVNNYFGTDSEEKKEPENVAERYGQYLRL